MEDPDQMDLQDADENYHESSDEDFNPTAVPAEESSSSSDEEAAPATARSAHRKRKRHVPSPTEFDSGDEATIEAARKRRSKKRKGQRDDDDADILLSEDEGGEGGLVKTRAQRRTEQKERKPLARTDGATVDVDTLWAQMSAAPLTQVSTSTPQILEETSPKSKTVPSKPIDGALHDENDANTVMVKRVYTFAGQRTTEEKRIPQSSLEAYIADGWKAVGTTEAPTVTEPSVETTNIDTTRAPKTRRPLRRPSRFDPNPEGLVRGLPPELQLKWPRMLTVVAATDRENAATPVANTALPRPEKAQKLNVVDKSRMDWTGYVDKEGIAEELQEHGKAKEAYLGRMDFLAGVDARREEERRRLKGVAASS